MRKLPALAQWLCLTLCVPLIASSSPEQPRKSDCKSLITHTGFAEFVMPKEGGTHQLTIKASPSVKWAIRNSDYVDWISILDPGAGAGPGTVTIKLEANTGRTCRVGELSIGGLMPIYGHPAYGLPIRILQQGTEAVAEENKGEKEESVPWLIELEPFSDGNTPQAPRRPEYKKTDKKR